VTATVAERIRMTEALRERGHWVAESDANFLWVKLVEDEDETPVLAELQQRGVLVRAGTPLGGPGFARVTLGTRAENDRFLAALAETLQTPA
jgi:histidinol-phosphate aminotransferase